MTTNAEALAANKIVNDYLLSEQGGGGTTPPDPTPPPVNNGRTAIVGVATFDLKHYNYNVPVTAYVTVPFSIPPSMSGTVASYLWPAGKWPTNYNRSYSISLAQGDFVNPIWGGNGNDLYVQFATPGSPVYNNYGVIKIPANTTVFVNIMAPADESFYYDFTPLK